MSEHKSEAELTAEKANALLKRFEDVLALEPLSATITGLVLSELGARVGLTFFNSMPGSVAEKSTHSGAFVAAMTDEMHTRFQEYLEKEVTKNEWQRQTRN